ncbi:MAG: tRNA uridine-5-carboxymethylaminomethyl(34) synthesis GTPase MnmE [Rhodospirillaceae bacterium]|nr:tRNA uridine-5-carboxymethylaminomethyl(34) synthesis GTPase MnmE [Rhodospirillaceae bacterium]
MVDDTIYALASGKGRAGLAIVRVSGALVDGCVNKLGLGTLEERKLSLVWITHPVTNKKIDHSMVAFFRGPRSYTGEDVLELHVHGGGGVLRLLFSALEACGCRLAEAGEFTLRAFNNDKLELTQVEAIADLIAAESNAQVEQALGQIGGTLKEVCETWQKSLIKVLAHIETCIDFVDEDIPKGVLDGSLNGLGNLTSEIESRLADNRIGERIRDGLEVCVIGAPNVGKSTLVNTLIRREAAIVSPVEGTTRDIIECQMSVGGLAVRLFDTAGIRTGTTDEIELEGISRAIARAKAADIIIALFDYRDFPRVDPVIGKFLEKSSIIVFNKTDKRAKLASSNRHQIHEGSEVLLLSLRSGTGVAELQDVLLKRVLELAPVAEGSIITRERHRVALEECLGYVRVALKQQELALIAENVRMALRGLGRVTGRVEVEQLLDVVFKDFCIGK